VKWNLPDAHRSFPQGFKLQVQQLDLRGEFFMLSSHSPSGCESPGDQKSAFECSNDPEGHFNLPPDPFAQLVETAALDVFSGPEIPSNGAASSQEI
jgi:hypothetical protein